MDPSLVSIVYIDWRVKKLGHSKNSTQTWLKVSNFHRGANEEGTHAVRELVDLLKKVYKSGECPSFSGPSTPYTAA
jgi:hypothetical protein